jgi:hypothetical protein
MALWNTIYRVGTSQTHYKKKGGDAMDTYQILTLLFVAGGFLLALLSYLDKRK